MEVDSDRDWTVVGWCWFGHKTAHPTTSILPHSRARSARRSRRNHAFMSADPFYEDVGAPAELGYPTSKCPNVNN
jgi:hypothetical protein